MEDMCDFRRRGSDHGVALDHIDRRRGAGLCCGVGFPGCPQKQGPTKQGARAICVRISSGSRRYWKQMAGRLLDRSSARFRRFLAELARNSLVDTSGKITIRHKGHLYKIGIGRGHKQQRIIALIDDLDIKIIQQDTGEILRHLTLDTTRTYQPKN